MLQVAKCQLSFIGRIFNAIVSCRSGSEACLLACEPYGVLPDKKSPVVREVGQASSCGPLREFPVHLRLWPGQGGPAAHKAT